MTNSFICPECGEQTQVQPCHMCDSFSQMCPPAETKVQQDLLPCPFCGDKMEPFGPSQHNHPSNGCWLASVRLMPEEYKRWNARANLAAQAPVQGSAAAEAVFHVLAPDHHERYEDLTSAQREIYERVACAAIDAARKVKP